MNEILTSLFSGGIWAIIKAVLILLLAFVTSAIVKSLVVKLFTKTKLNVLLRRANDEAVGNTPKGAGSEKAVEFIGKLVHLLVFLLFVPGIFENLGMREVSSPKIGRAHV